MTATKEAMLRDVGIETIQTLMPSERLKNGKVASDVFLAPQDVMSLAGQPMNIE